jgi:hypothetical protein
MLPPGSGAILMGAALLGILARGPAALRPGALPGELVHAPVQLALDALWAQRGWVGWVADDLHGFPARADRLLTEGLPIGPAWHAVWSHFGGGLGAWGAGLALSALGSAGVAAWAMLRERRAGAGMIAAVAWAVGEVLLRATGRGDSPALLAMALLPWVGACSERQGRGSLLAATIAGGAAASAPPLAPLLAGVLLGGRGSLPLGRTLGAAVVLLAPLLLPAAWGLARRHDAPGLALDPFATLQLAAGPERLVDAQAQESLAWGGAVAGTLARPVLLALAGLALWRARADRARVAAPFGLACLSLLLALGPFVRLPGGGSIVLPWGLLQQLPQMGTWSRSADLAVGCTLGLALLAARVPLRAGASALAGGLLLAEGALLSHAWPVPVFPLEPDGAAVLLAREDAAPLVLLPTGGGPMRRDRSDLLAQSVHGRPTAQGLTPTGHPLATHGERKLWSENDGLAALRACEDSPRSEVGEGLAPASLRDAGLLEVVVDTRLDPTGALATCVGGLLASWERQPMGPWMRWRAP